MRQKRYLQSHFLRVNESMMKHVVAVEHGRGHPRCNYCADHWREVHIKPFRLTRVGKTIAWLMAFIVTLEQSYDVFPISGQFLNCLNLDLTIRVKA